MRPHCLVAALLGFCLATPALAQTVTHGTYLGDTCPMGTLSFSPASQGFDTIDLVVPVQPQGTTGFFVDNVAVTTTDVPPLEVSGPAHGIRSRRGETLMPHAINKLNDRTLTATISGVFSRADQAAIQDAARALIAMAGTINVMVVLQGFTGFERGADWGDMDFYAQHADDIARMAIVGDPKWKDDVEAFTGAGMRTTKIEFFATAALAQAKAWVVAA